MRSDRLSAALPRYQMPMVLRFYTNIVQMLSMLGLSLILLKQFDFVSDCSIRIPMMTFVVIVLIDLNIIHFWILSLPKDSDPGTITFIGSKGKTSTSVLHITPSINWSSVIVSRYVFVSRILATGPQKRLDDCDARPVPRTPYVCNCFELWSPTSSLSGGGDDWVVVLPR